MQIKINKHISEAASQQLIIVKQLFDICIFQNSCYIKYKNRSLIF